VTGQEAIPGVTVRTLQPADLTEALELLASLSAFDNRHQSRRLLTASDSQEAYRAIVAKRNGVVIGAAALTPIPTLPGAASARVVVAETEQGRGVGSLLAHDISAAFHSSHPIRTVTCALRDDLHHGRGFAERYGFQVTNHSLGWRFDLTNSPDALEDRAVKAAEEARVSIRQADFESEEERITSCASRCITGFSIPFGGRQGVDLSNLRTVIPDGARTFLAETTGGPVGRPCGLVVVSPMSDDHRGSAWYTIFTGVDPDHRRRGVGTALKTTVLAEARRANAAVVTGHSDETNQSITRLNRGLGMATAVGYWSMALGEGQALDRPAPLG